MRELLVTSSVLILALLGLRALFRGSISRRAQYALWGLVLLRLLVPVSLPGTAFSVLTATEPVGRSVSAQLEDRTVYVLPVDRRPLSDFPSAAGQAPGTPVGTAESAGYRVVGGDGATVVKYAEKLTAAQALTALWYAGMAAMVAWFLFTNLRFRRRLRRGRTPYRVEGCKYPVYLVETGLPSPCLVGLFRPAIYLTPAAAASPESLRHVLAHETAHARQLDPLWSLLRCVCLAAYWFDPLVWAAALVSRTDCELSCDERALLALGEAERIPYGKTLLALVPVRRGPSDPLLSATTMTAGRRHLKDRITRIAENRQTRAAALFAALALVVGVCAVTFTGGKSAATQPLADEELAYFNEEFFNGEYLNIRNQFLSSLYQDPRDIDLFELFYCGVPNSETYNGITTSSDEENRLVYGDMLPDCARYKVVAAEMDALLTEYMGLTLADTNGVGLENFTYLQEYDAYYWAHGDTNYRSQVTFARGERQGNAIRLYYDDTYMADGWKCVTLEDLGNGAYHFVSHLRLPSRPSYDPDAVIDLTGSPVYAPPEVVMERHTNDFAETLASAPAKTHPLGGGYEIAVYRAADGSVCAGVVMTAMNSWQADCFLTIGYDLPPEAVSIGSFANVLGHDGFTLNYQIAMGVSRTAYYYFDEDGAVHLLAEASDLVWEPDLDGDGMKELLWRVNGAGNIGETDFLFLRDGQLTMENLNARVSEVYPDCDYLNFYCWGQDPDHITMDGTIPLSADGFSAGMTRNLYFDGAALYLYRTDGTYTDHVSDDIDAPEEVLTAAKAQVREALAWWQGHTGATDVVDGAEQQTGTQAEWDDWRITRLSPVTLPDFATDLGMEVYGLSYQLRSPTPELVEAAGGMYIEEDGWVGGFYVEHPFLMFQLKDGVRTQLDNSIPDDVGTDSPMFYGTVARSMAENGFLTPSELDGEPLAYWFYDNAIRFLNYLGTCDAAEQTAALEKLLAYAADDEWAASAVSDKLDALHWSSDGLDGGGEAAYQRLQSVVTDTGFLSQAASIVQQVLDAVSAGETASLTYSPADGVGGGTYPIRPADEKWERQVGDLPRDFRWRDLFDSYTPPGGSNALTLRSADGNTSLTCWPNVREVYCVLNGQPHWLQAESLTPADVIWDDTVFFVFRFWYDKVEIAALQGDIVIPDDGRSYLEIAQAWVDAKENASLLATPGSRYANTYVRNMVELADWVPDTAFPADTEGHERFYFNYTRIFVPENEDALSWQMAGNTTEYDGRYGEAPAGAFENFQIGPMYLAEDGWRCDGTGTGP